MPSITVTSYRSFIYPNQARYNGIGFWDNPYDGIHELTIEKYRKIATIWMYYHSTELVFMSSAPSQHARKMQIHVDDSGYSNTVEKCEYVPNISEDDILMNEITPIERALSELDATQIAYDKLP